MTEDHVIPFVCVSVHQNYLMNHWTDFIETLTKYWLKLLLQLISFWSQCNSIWSPQLIDFLPNIKMTITQLVLLNGSIGSHHLYKLWELAQNARSSFTICHLEAVSNKHFFKESCFLWTFVTFFLCTSVLFHFLFFFVGPPLICFSKKAFNNC